MKQRRSARMMLGNTKRHGQRYNGHSIARLHRHLLIPRLFFAIRPVQLRTRLP